MVLHVDILSCFDGRIVSAPLIDDSGIHEALYVHCFNVVNGSSASGEVLESVDRESKDAQVGVNGVHQEHEKEGLSLRPMVSTTTTSTAATVATAAAENQHDRYDDDDDDDNEARTNDGDALLEYRPGDSSTGGEGKREGGAEEGAGEKVGVVMAIRIMLGTDESASFFTAVVLSGMGRGVIDTFLFTR